MFGKLGSLFRRDHVAAGDLYYRKGQLGRAAELYAKASKYQQAARISQENGGPGYRGSNVESERVDALHVENDGEPRQIRGRPIGVYQKSAERWLELARGDDVIRH